MIVEGVALLFAFAVAGAVALLGTARAVRERRRIERICRTCGRLFVEKVPTCECDWLR